ncbi:hypothetical protein Tco_0857029 [Tanacetum coccineum]|uniref:Uncharacterized protein n=1 Tax=Tanacetum coccineum TaxID=301880 RepID=A0ABQ5B8H7_9ASTR
MNKELYDKVQHLLRLLQRLYSNGFRERKGDFVEGKRCKKPLKEKESLQLLEEQPSQKPKLRTETMMSLDKLALDCRLLKECTTIRESLDRNLHDYRKLQNRQDLYQPYLELLMNYDDIPPSGMGGVHTLEIEDRHYDSLMAERRYLYQEMM